MQSQRVVARRLRRQSIVFSILVVLSMAMLAVSNTSFAHEATGAAQYVFKPITSSINSVADGVGSIWSTVAEIDRLHADNDRLRQENEALKSELGRIPEVQRLYDDWNAITQTQKFVPYRTLPAAVLVQDTAGPERTIIIDHGSRDGIHENQVVIAAGGALVGRIVAVGPGTAQVRLITSIDSVVTARTIAPDGNTGVATGAVVGQIGGLLEMRVDANETLTKGQQVVTAGMATDKFRSHFPPALLVGQIVDVSRDANAIDQTAYLQPAVDFQNLQFVLVITNYEGGIVIDLQSPGAAPSPSRTPAGSPRPSAKP